MTNELTKWSAAQQSAGKKFAETWKDFADSKIGKPEASRFEAMSQIGAVTEVQKAHEAELLAHDNVVGVAVSRKMKAGKPKDKFVLTIYVSDKVKPDKLDKSAVIPPEINGVETDVVETGPIEALVFDARVRPALPGYSLGHYNITAGTFGALVRDRRGCRCKTEERHGHCCCHQQECKDDILILSNNHVLANVNQARPGDLILQPGPFDGGIYPGDMVATFERTEEIVFTRTPQNTGGYNLVDAALARPTDSRNVTASIIGVAAPTGVGQALPQMNVLKVGRTTEVTAGTVLATNATVAVGFGAAGIAIFRHQIITTNMAAGGDSGSLLMDFDLNGIGLLFAGSPVITIHNHLLDVQNTLGVDLVTTR